MNSKKLTITLIILEIEFGFNRTRASRRIAARFRGCTAALGDRRALLRAGDTSLSVFVRKKLLKQKKEGRKKALL
ncbi:MAG: hypothetical protein QHH75_04645 [Bacillota bacterium]|nr:hypothetical protein [Bacillota bacterium]